MSVRSRTATAGGPAPGLHAHRSARRRVPLGRRRRHRTGRPGVPSRVRLTLLPTAPLAVAGRHQPVPPGRARPWWPSRRIPLVVSPGSSGKVAGFDGNRVRRSTERRQIIGRRQRGRLPLDLLVWHAVLTVVAGQRHRPCVRSCFRGRCDIESNGPAQARSVATFYVVRDGHKLVAGSAAIADYGMQESHPRRTENALAHGMQAVGILRAQNGAAASGPPHLSPLPSVTEPTVRRTQTRRCRGETQRPSGSAQAAGGNRRRPPADTIRSFPLLS